MFNLHIFRVSDLSLFFQSIFCITGLKPCKSWSEKTNCVDTMVLKGQTFIMKLCGVDIWSHLMETTLCRTTHTFLIFASFWIMWLLVGSQFWCETVWWVVRKLILSLCGQSHLVVIQMIKAAHTSLILLPQMRMTWYGWYGMIWFALQLYSLNGYPKPPFQGFW